MAAYCLDSSHRQQDLLLVHWERLRRILCDDDLVLSVDEQVLSEHSDSKHHRRGASQHVPFAAIVDRHLWEEFGVFSVVPSRSITLRQGVFDPTSGYNLLAGVSTAFSQQKPEPREVARRRAEPAGEAWRTQSIYCYVGTARGTHRTPQQVTGDVGITLPVARSITQPIRSVLGDT